MIVISTLRSTAPWIRLPTFTTQGAIAKWLRRQIRIVIYVDSIHLFLFEGPGSNPAGVVSFFPTTMWFPTLSLIFGGCCSNAITLEHVTSQYPNSGSLITFLQFFLISLHGLPTHLTWTRLGPRFKPRRIPLTPYLGQVALFYMISLLNNAAFAYQIPMPVHIIFRSGGLVISMLLGWLVSNKRCVPPRFFFLAS